MGSTDPAVEAPKETEEKAADDSPVEFDQNVQNGAQFRFNFIHHKTEHHFRGPQYAAIY